LAVEEAATNKPTTAASDKIFVIIDLLRFRSPIATPVLGRSSWDYKNGWGLDLFKLAAAKFKPSTR
jgi:hypothetical protein